MTFTEAALVVLEREGKPMHAREIADKAVEWGLLSHVGKTPVQTMSTQLSSAVAKAREGGPLVRTKPGVFALAAWNGGAPGPKHVAPAPVAPAPVVPAPVAPAPVAPVPRVAAPRPAEVPAWDDEGEEEDGARDWEGPAVDPAELARSPQVGPEEPGAVRSKRKRRRKKKRSDEPETQASGAQVTGPSQRAPSSPQPQPQPQSQPQPQAPRPVVAPVPAQPPQQRPPQKPAPVPASPPVPQNVMQEPRAEVVPAVADDLIERAEAALRSSGRPVPTSILAEQLGQLGETAQLVLDALLAADGRERERVGLRPRFLLYRSGWATIEREVSADVLALDKQIAEARERNLRAAERQVLRKLRGLSQSALLQLAIGYLCRMGFSSIRPLDRGRKNELHFSVEDTRQAGRVRLAVVVRRDGGEEQVPDRAVVELRGALHHYGAAAGLVLTTALVSDAAREEAQVPNLPPVALVDGEAWARELVRVGLGVKERSVVIPSCDDGFFAMLETKP